MSPPPLEMLDAPAVAELARQLTVQAAARPPGSPRLLVGIAGIGGAGKSTFAAELMTSIDQCVPDQPDFARLVPMDGFHFRNATLDALNLRDRKGSPATFDAPAFIALLRKAKADVTQAIGFPIYDRSLHEPARLEDQAHTIAPATRLILTEGNYLLLDAQPWNALAGLLDQCWLLDTPIEQARDWMIARHIRGGRSADDARQHYDRTDWPNARLVQSSMRPPARRFRRV